MSATTLSRLRSLYPSFTESERRVADTILGQVEAVPGWSGRDLARASGTTEPVVFRLAGKLGFGGFKALKLALLQEQAAARTRTALGVFNIPIHHDAPIPVQAQEVLHAYVESLQRTAELVDAERLGEAARLLRQAPLVTVVGMGSSLAVATLAENVLLRCGVPCRTSQDAHVQLLHALQAVPGHVVVGFSYSGDTVETVDALDVAHASGARTIAVTAFERSPITRHADLVLLVPAVVGQQPYRVGLVDAVLPFLMLLDLLAIRITAAAPAAATALRERVERTVQRRKLSHPGPPTAPGPRANGSTPDEAREGEP